MPKTFAIREFLAAQLPIIDVRSEGEFAAGHIPGAVSLCLFNNTERAEIGTLYKQQGRQPAILRALEFVGPRMRSIAEAGLSLATDGKISVHCWRGGMRSASVAWLLESVGLQVAVLQGGYKSYRRHCRELFALPWHATVIGGKTGSQKTRVLGDLKAAGLQTIDLEALANHRGSAFGYLPTKEGSPSGVEGQPTQEQFENDLGMALSLCDNKKPVFIEDESRLIGRLYVPDAFRLLIRRSPVIVLEWPIERRIEYLISIYNAPAEKIRENLKAICKRLGMERYKSALMALDEGRLDEVCRIALDYYDRTYTYGLSLRDPTTLNYLPGETAVDEILMRFSWKSA